MAAPPTLSVQLLGGFRVLVAGRPVPDTAWRQKRAAAVVKLLALEPDHRLHRERLTDTLWPELEPEAAANNLRVALHRAREGLRAAGTSSDVFLSRDGDVINLGPAESVEVDVDGFATAIKNAWRTSDPEVS